jgi:hypothetical protein
MRILRGRRDEKRGGPFLLHFAGPPFKLAGAKALQKKKRPGRKRLLRGGTGRY